MRVRIAGVVLLASFISVSGASAQTPTPDPAPTPPPPVVEQPPPPVVEPTQTTTATTTADPAPARPKRKPHRRDAHDREKSQPAPEAVFEHETFAEAAPSAAAPSVKVRAIPTSATVAAAVDPHGSSIALILVFVLGSASLLVVALKGVRIEGLASVQAAISDHRGEVAYASVALLLGLGVGLLATIGLT